MPSKEKRTGSKGKHGMKKPSPRGKTTKTKTSPRKPRGAAPKTSSPGPKAVVINRAPVLTLWTAVVAERLGYDARESLTLGKAVAGLTAQVKGRRLGVFEGKTPKKSGLGEEFWIDICGRAVPAVETDDGIRAVVKDKPIDPEKVRKYLQAKFGEHLPHVRVAMQELAGSLNPSMLAGRAFELYAAFRPTIPKGARGWGRAGTLDLDYIRSLGRRWPRRNSRP